MYPSQPPSDPFLHRRTSNTDGCVLFSLLSLMLLWFASMVIVSALFVVAELLPEPELTQPLLTLAMHLALYCPLALFARRRWPILAGAAFGLAAASGFITLNDLLPWLDTSLVEQSPSILLLAALVYLLALVMPLYALWRRISLRAALHEIGLLARPNSRMLLLALAIAAPFLGIWVVIGAIGSSAQTQTALVHALTRALGLELLLRGIVFAAFAQPGARDWQTIVWSALVGALIAAEGQVQADLTWAIVMAPLAGTGVFLLGLLLGTLQAASGRYLPATVLVALIYSGSPLLFSDPRGTELVHILAQFLLPFLALSLAGVLFLMRNDLRIERLPRQSLVYPLLIPTLLWAGVVGLYFGLGSPGVYEDGFVIVLKEQADLQDAKQIEDRTERLRFVRTRLLETARTSQAQLRSELDKLGVPYRPYYLVNMIRVDGHPDLAARFANHPDVTRIDRNPNVRRYRYRIPLPSTDESIERDPADSCPLERNLCHIGVQAAWEMGVYGKGVLVAGADSGYVWDHEALQRQYAGWNGSSADHNYHWHDSWDAEAIPFDDDGHGTHTMGTIVGDGGPGNEIGIAPEARWIGCRNMRQGLGNPASYTECMEFFLAPYPHGGDPFTDGDPSRAPMVVNNSWGCPEIEGCEPNTLALAAEHLRMAGIMMVVSAGNDGPDCSTVQHAPAIYDSVFSVGALDMDDPQTAADEGEQLAKFSSRGPVITDRSGRLKPDISAPGVGIRSSTPRGYGRSDGTSMAGPHVAGLAALIFSADPSLIGDIDRTEQLIRETAKPGSTTVPACGDTAQESPNNSYGFGIIDVEAAVQAALGR